MIHFFFIWFFWFHFARYESACVRWIEDELHSSHSFELWNVMRRVSVMTSTPVCIEQTYNIYFSSIFLHISKCIAYSVYTYSLFHNDGCKLLCCTLVWEYNFSCIRNISYFFSFFSFFFIVRQCFWFCVYDSCFRVNEKKKTPIVALPINGKYIDEKKTSPTF